MIIFEKIIERMKVAAHITTDKDVALILGLSPPDFSRRKKAGSLLPLIIEWAINENVELDWLIKGEKQGYQAAPIYNEGEKVKPSPDQWDKPALGRAVEQLSKIYAARDPVMIRAINANLDAFSRSADLAAAQQALADRMAILEKTISELKNPPAGCCIEPTPDHEPHPAESSS